MNYGFWIGAVGSEKKYVKGAFFFFKGPISEGENFENFLFVWTKNKIYPWNINVMDDKQILELPISFAFFKGNEKFHCSFKSVQISLETFEKKKRKASEKIAGAKKISFYTAQHEIIKYTITMYLYFSESKIQFYSHLIFKTEVLWKNRTVINVWQWVYLPSRAPYKYYLQFSLLDCQTAILKIFFEATLQHRNARGNSTPKEMNNNNYK